MLIAAVGLNHHTAPVELRERLALNNGQLGDAVEALRGYVRYGAILSTCNRTEVYALVGHLTSGMEKLERFLGEYCQVDPAHFGPHLYRHQQEEAVRHLFRVAAGIDSLILGEEQILAQVRQAAEAAQAGGLLGPVLDRFFRQAVTVGKRARAWTEISRGALSVGSAACGVARQVLGTLEGRVALVVGAGEMGRLTARHLRDYGAQILVAGRTQARTQALAEELRGQTLSLGQLTWGLEQADMVISCTAAAGQVIPRSMVAEAMVRRSQRPLLLVDIAVPRDVDPEVRDLPGVSLYDIDDLKGIAENNRRDRAREMGRVEAIVEAEVAKFLEWWDSLEVLPTVRALRQRAEEIRRQELERTFRRLGSVSPEERRRLEALTAAIIKKFLHQATTRLKEKDDGRNYARAVRELFALDGMGQIEH